MGDRHTRLWGKGNTLTVRSLLSFNILGYRSLNILKASRGNVTVVHRHIRLCSLLPKKVKIKAPSTASNIYKDICRASIADSLPAERQSMDRCDHSVIEILSSGYGLGRTRHLI
jgi:hypothetical protein